MEIVLQSSFAIDLHKTANELYIRAIEARRNAYSKSQPKSMTFSYLHCHEIVMNIDKFRWMNN